MLPEALADLYKTAHPFHNSNVRRSGSLQVFRASKEPGQLSSGAQRCRDLQLPRRARGTEGRVSWTTQPGVQRCGDLPVPRRAAGTRKPSKSLLPVAGFVLRTASGSVRGRQQGSGHRAPGARGSHGWGCPGSRGCLPLSSISCACWAMTGPARPGRPNRGAVSKPSCVLAKALGSREGVGLPKNSYSLMPLTTTTHREREDMEKAYRPTLLIKREKQHIPRSNNFKKSASIKGLMFNTYYSCYCYYYYCNLR